MLGKDLLFLVNKASLYIIVLTILAVPLFFLPITSDFLELPKQMLLTAATLILLLLFGLKTILEGKASFRRSPFDLPLAILFIVVLASALTSVGPFTSIISALPLLAIILFPLILFNNIVSKTEERLVVSALITSGLILAVFNTLQFFKVFVLPYPVAKTSAFSLSGSLLASSIFLICLLPIAISFIRSYLSRFRGVPKNAGEEELWAGFYIGAAVVIVIGFAIGLYQIATVTKPAFLPQNAGLRSALQPLGLDFKSAIIGTGPGTYFFDFTRFRDPQLNNDSNLWNLRFTNSSSLFLEIVATLGIIGTLSFLFLIARLFSSFVKSSLKEPQTVGVLLSAILLFLLSFFLPFSFTPLFLLFLLLGIYTVRLAMEESPQVFDVIISVVALKKGLISLTPIETSQEQTLEKNNASDLLPYILSLIFLVISAGTFYGMYRFLLSDILFQKALVAASNNQATQTYELQDKAIKSFPQRDLYHRIFSQTNFVIANSIANQTAASAQSGSGGLTDVDRQRIVTLVQQAINYGRNAVTLAPLNVQNWENLTNVYRGLIGFAQDSDRFAVASAQQAVSLDPTNPLVRLSLGGIYYQLGQYDAAINEFRTVVQLKNDFANGHYNLGHGFEAKGDLESLKTALAEYQTVRNLVPPGSDDFKKIEAELAALQKRIQPPPPKQEAEPSGQPTGQQEPLKVGTPSATLPEQKPPVKVEGPPPPATTSGEENK